MVDIVKMYSVKCDVCEKVHTDDHNSGCVAWDDAGYAVEIAQDSGWHVDDTGRFTKHYCPDCHHIGDDDNVVVKEIEE